MNPRNDILSRCGLLLPGDANRDGVVDLTDLSTVASNFRQTGKTWADGDFNGDGVVDVSDLTVTAGNYRKTVPLPRRLAVTAGWHARQYPAAGLPLIRFSWDYTPDVLRANLVKYDADPPLPRIVIWDYEGRPEQGGKDANAACDVILPVAEAARSAGWSFGVCSICPQTRPARWDGLTAEEADALFRARLIDSGAVDWLACEMYGHVGRERISEWLAASADWPVCRMPLLHPILSGPATPAEWAATLEIARDHAELTCLWHEKIDSLPGMWTGPERRWAYDLAALQTFGLDPAAWLQGAGQ